jgi:segregation and condensation protein A
MMEEEIKHEQQQEPAVENTESTEPKAHHEQLYELLMKEDEITWQTLIFDLIKTEQMDPWDINVSLLSKMYIKALKKIKELNLRISGKMLLAAALLLRIKSTRLVGDDLLEFDRLLASGENPNDLYGEEGFVEGQLNQMGMTMGQGQTTLIPRTPQPRKRKVSVYDLIDALAIALNVRRRRILSQIQTRTLDIPENKFDISQLMDDLYNVVVEFLMRDNSEKVAFSNLIPGEAKRDKVLTFIPLLHLTNSRKIDLEQKRHFEEIWVSLAKHKAEKEEPEIKEPEQKPKRRKARVKKQEPNAELTQEVPQQIMQPSEEVKEDKQQDVIGPAA